MMRQAVRVLHEDRPIVESQLPKKSEYRMGEKLIKGNQAIIIFRKMREKRQNY
ncbi:MAG: hypothetical protein ACRDCC_04345 [Culicoidibacterales bacterium]